MSELKIKRTVLSECVTNCYFLFGEAENHVVVIDPGDEGAELYENFTDNGITVDAILLTHGHFDHICGVNELRRLSGCKVYALDEEKEVLENPDISMTKFYGLRQVVTPDVYLHDKEEFDLSGIHFQVIHTPGHTVGSCCYYVKDAGVLFSGDTLFEESVGRTDFPTGSSGALIRSVKEQLFVLPPETVVYSGHGERTTIEHEMKYNPFCQ